MDVDGVVEGLRGTCPNLTFTVVGRTVRVGRDTTFRDGSCNVLLAGVRVKVRGRRAADGAIDAARIEFDNRAPAVAVEGEIRVVTGACPSVTVTIGDRVVRTTRDTAFQGGSCGDLRTGARVEIAGRRAADGSIEANRVEIERLASAEVELTGVVTATSSGCPAGSFTMRVGSESLVVRTTDTTQFRNGQCRNLRTTGRRLEVKGRRAMDGAIDATRVEFRR